mmetsp:Transcript_3306/g.7858  ORF Transcript_3306/g.7858 Transcript_3306/m.7858 type:complete len:236 (+) Transcript_3306:227-934(+)
MFATFSSTLSAPSSSSSSASPSPASPPQGTSCTPSPLLLRGRSSDGGRSYPPHWRSTPDSFMALTRYVTTSLRWACSARSTGWSPNMSTAPTSAPHATSALHAPSSPMSAAKCSAVYPLSLALFTCAPNPMSWWMTVAEPPNAAACRALNWRRALSSTHSAFTSAPCATNAATVSVSPSLQAFDSCLSGSGIPCIRGSTSAPPRRRRIPSAPAHRSPPGMQTETRGRPAPDARAA